MNKKAGFILLGTGIGIALLVVLISLSAYGKIYFFDGYEITKFAWVAVIGCIASGIVAFLSDSNVWIITLVVALVIAFCVSCDISSSSSSSSDKCAVCGGSGLVNTGFVDFKTCPVCKGSGVDFH